MEGSSFCTRSFVCSDFVALGHHPAFLVPTVDLALASQDGSTPLITASDNGHEVVVERLIAARANVESKNQVLHAREISSTPDRHPIHLGL